MPLKPARCGAAIGGNADDPNLDPSIFSGTLDSLLGAPPAMSSTDSTQALCAPDFNAVGAAFERNMDDGDVGAAFALYQGGALKVDLWAGHRDAARKGTSE
ncbi:MAG: hypothetical protein QF609_03475 [Gammaproteobacteria bacterium]|nr:hypothetical protein [Gammaproteobacteria bacterium]